jgi:hypothetical protein
MPTGKLSTEMNKKVGSNLIVGYFAFGGDFSSLVGIGLNSWWAEREAAMQA